MIALGLGGAVAGLLEDGSVQQMAANVAVMPLAIFVSIQTDTTHLTVKRINKMMITELLAGACRTLVVSMLSERVVLKVLVMFAEWASANSSTSIDDKIVS